MKSIYFLFLVAIPLSVLAFDSSAGKSVNEIISKVEFVNGPDLKPYPRLFEWSDETRSEFIRRFREVLFKMPLDVAQVPYVQKIIVSNSSCINDVKAFEEVKTKLQELENPNLPYLERVFIETELAFFGMFCGTKNADWIPLRKEIRFSGAILLGKVEKSSGERDLFPEVVLHEFTHAWELETMVSNQDITEKSKPFYSMQYLKRSKDLKKLMQKLIRQVKQQETADIDNLNKNFSSQVKASSRQARREHRIMNDFGELMDQNTTAARAIWDRYESKLNSEKNDLYARLNLPSRYHGKTGRCWTLGGDPSCKQMIRSSMLSDQHAMDAPTEYLATLSELLWADPELAKIFYSPEEISWVQRVVFENRM